MEIDVEWHAWKKIIGAALRAGRALGASEKNLEGLAYYVGGVMADHFDPGNREQRLLKELWEQGDEREKRALAALFTRMAKNYISRPGPDAETGSPDVH